MDVITKARELGEAIADSEEMADLKRYEAALEADAEASRLLEEYNALLFEIAQMEKAGHDRQAVLAKKERLNAKMEEINCCDTARGYLAAKSRFDRMIKTVNAVITFEITGEEQQGSGGCGGGCGSCMRNRAVDVAVTFNNE